MRLPALTQNLSLKLFSLVVSVLLFLFVSIESATPVDVDFRVEYRTADDIMIVGDAPTVLHTTLRGPWATFRSYDIAEIHPVVIDVMDAGPGTIRRSISTSDVDPPGGMSVVAVRPSELELTLDRKVERQVPVQVDIVGRPAVGYELEAVDVSPARVRVSGPTASMQAIDYLYTRSVNVEGRQDDFTAEVDVRTPPVPLRLKDKRVSVTVRIFEELVTRSFDGLPVRLVGAPAGTRAVPETVSVKLKGPRNLVESLDPELLEPYVEAQPELDEGLAQFEKAVGLRGNPERTQWIGTAPRVQIIVPKSKVKKPSKRK